MKVIYEKPISERIRRAVYEAECAYKVIGWIDLTAREANELSREIQRTLYVPDGTQFRSYTVADAGKVVGTFYGAEIRVESP